MSSSVIVFGANGYLGSGIANGLRRAGFRVYGAIRNSRYSAYLVQNEIEPVVLESFDKVELFADILAKCSIVVDAVGFKKDLSSILFQAVVSAGKQRTQDGKSPQYAPLFIFTSGIMTYGDTSMYGARPIDETIKPKPLSVEIKAREEFEDFILASSSNVVHTSVVRPGFVYGDRGGIVADLFYLEKPAIIKGRRDKRWSWVHINDLGDGYALIARAPRAIVSGQMWNLAAPNDNPTYDEVRTAMARVSGQEIEYKDAMSDDKTPNRWDTDSIINPSKAMDQLGWRPRHIGFVQEIETYYRAWIAHKQ